jgi:hypothetical protein
MKIKIKLSVLMIAIVVAVAITNCLDSVLDYEKALNRP